MRVWLQVVLGLAAACALWYASNSTAQSELQLPATGAAATAPSPGATAVVVGQVPFAGGNLAFDTVNTGAPNYRALLRSVNMDGGAQFSYSLWVQVTSGDVGGLVLLLRGVNQRNQLGVFVNGVQQQRYAGVLVRCPCLRFGRGADELVVEFNCVKDALRAVTVRNSSVRSLLLGRYALIAVAFSDATGPDGFDDGVAVRVYVNDTLIYADAVAGDALLQNDGNLFVLPAPPPGTPGSGQPAAGFVADVTYYNYALTDAQVAAVYQAGAAVGRGALVKPYNMPGAVS